MFQEQQSIAPDLIPASEYTPQLSPKLTAKDQKLQRKAFFANDLNARISVF